MFLLIFYDSVHNAIGLIFFDLFNNMRNKLAITLIILISIFFSIRLLSAWIDSASSRVMGQISTGNVNISHIARNISTIFDVIKERDDLKNQLNSYSSEESQIAELQRENDDLRQQLNVSRATQRKLIDANIISRTSGLTTGEAITINKGLRDGVEKGDMVVEAGNILIGKIVEAYEARSLVRLISDKRFVVSVKISGSSAVGDIKQVQDGSTSKFILDFITSTEAAAPHDIIVTSGIDGAPVGLVVGEISDIKENTGLLFKNVEIQPRFQNFTSPLVFVVKPS